MHHAWRNHSPQSRSYALEAVLPPAVGIDLDTPRKRPGDPYRQWIFVLGESISGGYNHPPPLTYLSRSLDPELFQPRKSDRHAVERPRHRVIILHSQRGPLRVAVRCPNTVFCGLRFSIFVLFWPPKAPSCFPLISCHLESSAALTHSFPLP